MPRAPPAPEPTAAGRLTAKSDGVATPLRTVASSSAPPARPMLDGKSRPVALPPSGPAVARPPHCTPISRVNVERASTMRASMEICGVWVSSCRARARTSSRLARTSLTRRGVGALVDLDLALGREQRRELAAQRLGGGVVQGDNVGARRLGLHGGGAAGGLGLVLLVERLALSDADEVALLAVPQALGGEDHLERLVPGDALHADGDLRVDLVGDDDVDLADVGQEAEQIVDRRLLEVELDGGAAVDLAAAVVHLGDGLLGDGRGGAAAEAADHRGRDVLGARRSPGGLGDLARG